MPKVDLLDVSFGYTSATPLMSGATVALHEGWTGLVGANGAGKSTLLRLIAGELAPDTGTLHPEPARGQICLCPQRVEGCDPSLRELAARLDGTGSRLRGTLRLDPDQLERWPTLSPGERKRWQIGAALAAEPHVLLLDEPTNHLDGEARDVLRAALEGFEGVGVLVSHDRALLNALCVRTMRLHGGSLCLYRGSYASARRSWEREERERDRAWERIRGEERKLRRRLQAQSERRQQLKRKLRRTGPGEGGEHAASSSFKSHRRRSSSISLARDMRVTRRAVERVESRLEGFRFDRELGRALFLDFEPAPVPVLLEARCPRIGPTPETALIEDVDLMVQRESRIHLAGPNGAGKSTLLGRLLERARVPKERLLVLPQELSVSDELALLERARGLEPSTRGRVLGLVAALGVDPERLLASARPSPGEARKLCLALGLGTLAYGLLLDEPTNHLDLPAIERLQEALVAYPGALVLVSHDEELAHATAQTVWRIRKQRVEVESQ
jgi:ATPase subunit of ABC transporter with duplicated ATPase domains